MQLGFIPVRAQQARGHFGGHMDVVNVLVQPVLEQPVQEAGNTGNAT